MESMSKKTKIMIGVGVVIVIAIIAGLAGFGENTFEAISEMLSRNAG
jgi:hypothetical protein